MFTLIIWLTFYGLILVDYPEGIMLAFLLLTKVIFFLTRALLKTTSPQYQKALKTNHYFDSQRIIAILSYKKVSV
jgi:hypothetical protein